MKLDKENFTAIIDATPLVSIDLIVTNASGEILLGRRRNRPAQGYWFVPGGRIRKNEKSQDALQRIVEAELGVPLQDGELLGVFDHIYDDNYYDVAGVSTHYVVLGYRCRVDHHDRIQPDEQHEELKWWTVDALMASAEVHENTKLYFHKTTDNGFRCLCGD